MGAGEFNGIAFNSEGTLFATSTSYSYYPYVTSLHRVNPDTGSTTRLGSVSGQTDISDLGSCALPKPELRVTKEVNPARVVTAGDTLTYTIRVANIGSLDSTDTTLADQLPAGVTYVRNSTTLQGVAVPDSPSSPYLPFATARKVHTATTPGVVAAGETAVVSFKVRVDPGQTRVCNQGNVVYVGSALGGIRTDDPQIPGAHDATCIEVRTPAIALDKHSDVTELRGLAQEVTYHFDVTNTGDEPLRDVTLVDDKCTASPVLVDGRNTGDTNANGWLDPGTETWRFTCTIGLDPATGQWPHINTAITTGIGVLSGKSVDAKDDWSITSAAPGDGITLSKTAGEVVGPDAEGNYRVAYVITVKNDKATATAYGPLTDVPAFDPDATPLRASWTGPAGAGEAALVASSNPPYSFQLAPAHTRLAGDDVHTYRVALDYTHSGKGGIDECAGSAGTGLHNSVRMPGAEDSDCTVPGPAFAVKKAAEGGVPGGIGSPIAAEWDPSTATFRATARFVVSVTNSGTVSAVTPAVTDSLSLPDGFSLESMTINGKAVPNPSSTFTIPAGDKPVNPGASVEHIVVVTGRSAPNAVIDWASIAQCGSTQGGAFSGGFANAVDLLDDSDGPTNNHACVPVQPPKVDLTVEKYGARCDVNRPLCELPGAEFALYDVDPTTPGARPLPFALSPEGQPAWRFRAQGLPIGDYWLVETKAPAGFSLLAEPIRLTLTAAGVRVAAGGPSQASVPDDKPFTVAITDQAVAPLPLSGGDGYLTHLLLGLTLVVVGAGAAFMTSGQRPRPAKDRT